MNRPRNCEGGFLIGYGTTVNVQVGDDHKLGPFVPLAFTRQSSVTVRSEAKQRPHGSGELCRIRASEAGSEAEDGAQWSDGVNGG